MVRLDILKMPTFCKCAMPSNVSELKPSVLQDPIRRMERPARYGGSNPQCPGEAEAADLSIQGHYGHTASSSQG